MKINATNLCWYLQLTTENTTDRLVKMQSHLLSYLNGIFIMNNEMVINKREGKNRGYY